MHQDFALLATITVALLVAFAGGLVARRLGLPTLVGYLAAGMVIGPFTPGFVGDTGAISQLAEMGVIFMMFGVGIHFSLKDLWAVRKIAIPGAVLQITLGTLLGFGLTRLWGWSVSAGLVLGLSVSIASTVVLLRGLADHGLVNTIHGRVAIGWLVLEDLATVAILVLLPALAGSQSTGGNVWWETARVILTTGAFVAIMLFLGARAMPWLLNRIALSRSRELFILAVVALALGTAFGAAELFGVSLALGAFLAGVVIGESEIGHQVGAEVIPFRDVFSVLFFVSVGMLVNPLVVLQNIGPVLAVTALVVIGKWLINLLLGLVLPASAQTVLVVAAGLSQIGEFSFLLGSAGVSLGLLSREQYGLILAAAVLSIMINPFMFDGIPLATRTLKRVPWFWRWLDKSGPVPDAVRKGIKDHVIIVGHGRVGKHIGRVLAQLEHPYLVVESDAVRAREMQKEGVPTLFGDAANSEILAYTRLADARALVVTVSDEVTTQLVVGAAQAMAPHVPIIARAITEAGVQRLAVQGASHIIHPELEGGLEIVRHTLLTLNYSMGQIQQYVDSVRSDTYAAVSAEGKRAFVLDQLLTAVRAVEIAWHPVEDCSAVVGKSLLEADLRARTGASVIALVRAGSVLPNPKSGTVFEEGDMVGLIGTPAEVAATALLLAPVTSEDIAAAELDEAGFERVE
jgi:CPA2 family monovalent cation:H+ antiporter-2